MMNPSIPTYSGRTFSWRGSEGFCEASELTNCGVPFDGRAWSDACDLGFRVTSHRTGLTRLFILEEVGDNDGDVTHWRYREYIADGFSEITITVFND